MMKCGSGSKKIVRPTNLGTTYGCKFTPTFYTQVEETLTTPAVNENIVLSQTLNKGFYYFDFSCNGINNSLVNQPAAIIRGWLDFGLGTVAPVDNTIRSQQNIAVATAVKSFFMMRSQSPVFEITVDGTILSVTFESSNVHTDIDLYNKVLNVFKVTGYTNIAIS